MKKFKNSAYAGVIALLSVTSFTACSSSDDAVAGADVNPTYDGTGVRTDFAFNITKASTMRMTAANVQENNSFLGMKNMFLLPFSEEPAANKTTNYASGSVKNYALGSLTGITAEQSSKVYSLTIPVGTNNFLFYGTADGSGTNFQKGKVTSSLTKETENTNDITFGLTSIATDLGTDGTNIANYLTAIANTTDWEGTVTTAQTDGRYAAIALLYTKFTKNITQYAGSAEAVKRLVLDLYKSAKAINAHSSVYEIQTIAKAICMSINSDSNGLKISITDTDTDPDNWTATLTGFTDNTFPSGATGLNLPMGAAQLTWKDTDKKFEYKVTTATNVGTTTTAALSDYRYPAELIYFDNSPLRATDKYKNASDYPTTTTTWDTADNWTDWTQSAVTATTRAVAMTNNVNYGVAMLVSKVELTQASMTDNMAAIIGGSATNQTITAAETKDIANKKSAFKVTGILVGGQPAQVGWNMVPTSTTFNSVIYDNDVTFKETALSTTTATANNYTLVFDNYDAGGTQKDVVIALQIVNDGCDFYGAEGMIPAGSTFYLIGKLDLANNTTTWAGATRGTDTYRITNESTKRVFIQDYKTTANITLGTDALSKAYSAIPDLRATEVLFGLSVDLTWEPGLTFDVNM